jgi:MFS family permease
MKNKNYSAHINEEQVDNPPTSLRLEKPQGSLIDQIIGKYGYGTNIILYILCAILVISVSGYFTTLFSSTILAYQKLFNLNDNDLMAIATLYFIFKITGSMTVGHITKKISRITVINTALVLLTICNILMGVFYKNLPWMYCSRVLTGFFSGNIETLITNVLCEHLPIHYRGLILTSVWTGWSIGQIIPNLIMLRFMRNFESSGLDKTIILSTFIPLTALIFCLLFLKDSPRHFILKEDYNKGFQILKTYEPNITEEMKNVMIKEIKEGVNKQHKGKFRELFYKKFRLLTFCILFLNFMSNMLNDGFALIVNLTLEEIDNSNILWDAITVIIFSMPSCFIAGVLSDIKWIGRKWCNFMGYLFLCLSLILAVVFPSKISLFLGLYNIFINFGNIVIVTYTSEIYPSKLRDLASSMGFTFSNLGSCSSQMIFIKLHQLSTFSPYYFIIAVCLVCSMISWVLPYETYRRPLDCEFSDQPVEKPEIEMK